MSAITNCMECPHRDDRYDPPRCGHPNLFYMSDLAFSQNWRVRTLSCPLRGPKAVDRWPVDEGDVWCEECNYPLPPALEGGPGECPHCGIVLPDRRHLMEE